ncbi:MAG: hypothetical protein WBG36_07630 [Ornithinimicrobium sp.]
MSSLAQVPTRFIVSHLNLRRTTARKDEALLRDAPLVGVLASSDDAKHAWLTTGQALQHALLVAAVHGLLAGYSNQPCQVPPLR